MDPLATAAARAIAYRHRVMAERAATPAPYAEMAIIFNAPLPESGSDGTETITDLATLAESGLHATEAAADRATAAIRHAWHAVQQAPATTDRFPA